jgi:hypothetical protein
MENEPNRLVFGGLEGDLCIDCAAAVDSLALRKDFETGHDGLLAREGDLTAARRHDVEVRLADQHIICAAATRPLFDHVVGSGQ